MAGWEVGDVYPASETFRVGDTLDSPDAVVLRIEAPDGTRQYVPATPASTGVFNHNVTLSQAGVWSLTWSGTGTPTAVRSERIYVAPNAVPAEAE